MRLWTGRAGRIRSGQNIPTTRVGDRPASISAAGCQPPYGLIDRPVALGSQPELTGQDVAYVTSAFRCQSDAERERAAARLALNPAYFLADATPLVSAAPDDDLAVADNANDLLGRFTRRWLDAGGRPEDVEAEFASWLDGRYGVCLRSPTPELILAKEGVAQAIQALAARPMPHEDSWRETLRGSIARRARPSVRQRRAGAVRASQLAGRSHQRSSGPIARRVHAGLTGRRRLLSRRLSRHWPRPPGGRPSQRAAHLPFSRQAIPRCRPTPRMSGGAGAWTAGPRSARWVASSTPWSPGRRRGTVGVSRLGPRDRPSTGIPRGPGAAPRAQ
jgi:hypothetical protein